MKILLSITMAAGLIFAGCGGDSTTETDTGVGGGTADIAAAQDAGGEAADVVAPKDTGSATGGLDIVIGAAKDTQVVDAGPAPMTTPESCRQAFNCTAITCNDDTCRAECAKGLGEAITAPLGALQACLDGTCTGDDPVQCALDEAVCYDQFYACWFNGKSGAEGQASDCKDLSGCVEACPADDEACVMGCLEQGDAVGQRDYAILAFCVAEECGLTPDAACKKLAEENICGTHYGHCLNF